MAGAVYDKKMTNLSAAVHIYTKLKLAGLTVADVNKLEIKKDFEKLLGPERMACLAEGEHLHWNATLFTNGWETWNLSEIMMINHAIRMKYVKTCLPGFLG